MIEAKIICDSVNPTGQRLTTFQLHYPRFIHAEFMTHRRFSRNASSSRAMPTAKLLEEVRSDALRATPVFWGKNQPGMQAIEELTGEELDYVKQGWIWGALQASYIAERMHMYGAHKQIVNRLLEPFIHINVVCTATEYMNFFGLRLDAAAQPEMCALAEAMWAAYGESEPVPVILGDWHLPFVELNPTTDTELADENAIMQYSDLTAMSGGPSSKWSSPIDVAIRVSVARCARVSYMSNDTGKRSTVEEDLALYGRLLGAQPLHASPAEHQATPDDVGRDARPEQCGNFSGWRQYRKMLTGEAVAPLPKGYAP